MGQVCAALVVVIRNVHMESPSVAALRAARLWIGTPIFDHVVLIVQHRPGREHNAVHAHVVGNGAGNIIALGGDIAHLHVADNRGFGVYGNTRRTQAVGIAVLIIGVDVRAVFAALIVVVRNIYMEGPCIAVLRAACFRIRVPIPEQIILPVCSRPSREHHAFNAGGIGHRTGNIIALVGDIGHLHIADDRAVLIAYREIHSTFLDARMAACTLIDGVHAVSVFSRFISGDPQIIAMVITNISGNILVQVGALGICFALQDKLSVQIHIDLQRSIGCIPVERPADQPEAAFFRNTAVQCAKGVAGTVIHALEQAHGNIALYAIIQDMSQVAGAGAGSFAHIDIFAFADHANLIAPFFAVAGVDVGTAAARFLIPARIGGGAAQFISVRVGFWRFPCIVHTYNFVISRIAIIIKPAMPRAIDVAKACLHNI